MITKTVKAIDGMQVDWSPDGQRFAFTDVDNTSTRPDMLFTMNADGTELRAIARWTYDAKWSPDGIQIVCSQMGTLVVLDPKEDYVADDRKINTLHSPVHHFAWSPDGKTVAFADDYNLYLINPSGSSKKHLLKGEHFIRCISWSPDGHWVLYECLGVQAINVHDLRAQTVSPYGRSPVWSPATNKIAFHINDSVFSDDPHVPGGIRIFDFDSSQTEVIELGRDEIPFHMRNALAWSPDGRRLVFAMKEEWIVKKQPPAVYTLDISTKKFTLQIEGSHIIDSAIKWSPDGTKIAVFLKEDGFTRILDVK